ncbi:hypothetical protein COCNU_13G008090 [Cocos nucifera]|uniref:Uncharacterized protein n=1 Tax=Cocos nucifera TaxID=13894 RepID=A0A8K0NBI7_COCNU|nr:hypothetical protein COCNU_13G008090 [Cocos nucifera]
MAAQWAVVPTVDLIFMEGIAPNHRDSIDHFQEDELHERLRNIPNECKVDEQIELYDKSKIEEVMANVTNNLQLANEEFEVQPGEIYNKEDLSEEDLSKSDDEETCSFIESDDDMRLHLFCVVSMDKGCGIGGRVHDRANTPHMVREPSLRPPPSSSNLGISGRGHGKTNTPRMVEEPSLRPPPFSSDPPSLEASIPGSSCRTPSMPHDPSPEDESVGQEHMDLPNDGRTLITITLDRRFYPDTVTRWILDLIRMHISCPEITFRKWPQATKDFVFQRFMDVYKFKTRADEVLTRQVFEKCVSGQLSDILISDKRKKAKERKKTDNIVDRKGCGPR